MKSIISKTLTLVAIVGALLSFTPNFGGEGFEISLNGKVLLQQFGKHLDVVKTLQLNNAAPGDQISIRYHHCGKVGKNRIVAIKNEQNKIIKEWRFKDVQNPVSDMSCPVKDLLHLKNGGTQILKLYYSSSELPEGRQLAIVSIEKNQNITALLFLPGVLYL